jgi:5-methylcytosine-specific restriction endonuclease McrA
MGRIGQLAFPKGRPLRAIKRDKRQARAELIRAVRLRVMQRDASCRVCGRTDRPEMHELVSRAMRRGQPPETIFTLDNCLRLCSTCHAKVTRHEITLVPASDRLGANDPIEVKRTFVSRLRRESSALDRPTPGTLADVFAREDARLQEEADVRSTKSRD